MAMRDWHILIVEDEPDGQDVISGILGYFEVSTHICATAEDALVALEQHTFTAAILDLALPRMDGLQLLKAIRENPRTGSLPCVVVTAFHSSQVKQQTLMAGADAYFAKPIDDTAFIRELDRLLTE